MLQRDERLVAENSSTSFDFRTAYERDRDRVLYSAQFRRLGGITQITTPTELHTFHNRLTHTLEVAQLARRIAERAVRQFPDAAAEVSPDACEAAALAHDLGHPPHGHNGERILDIIARGEDSVYRPSRPIADGFEGNAQSLRILLKLAVRSHDKRGLNLTAASLRASIKYPWLRGGNPRYPAKFGVFQTEAAEFERIWDGERPLIQSLEGQIVDWADDVAYSTHDFFDFALAGIIPIALLKLTTVQELRDLLAEDPAVADIPEPAFQFVVHMFTLLPDPPLLSASRLPASCVGMLRDWVSVLIARYVSHQICFEKRGDYYYFETNAWVECEIAILKAITYRFAIGSPALAVRHEGERRILRTLFEVLYNDAIGAGERLLSEDARDRIQGGEEPARVVLDVLSSITDAQSISLYQRLTGQTQTSVLDTAATSFL